MNAAARRTTVDFDTNLANHATGVEQEIIELVSQVEARPDDERLGAQLEALYDELARTADALAENSDITRSAA